MRTMGFEEKWIALVMKCVKSVSYSVLVNGVPYGNILPSRGLRQGDPLSPYLFLIAAEGLSSLLSRAALDNRLTGVSIFVGGYRLSHLFFPDDSLLFCRATAEEWENLSLVLKLYERASGQQLNAAKTSIFFSKNTSLETNTWDCQRWWGDPRLVLSKVFVVGCRRRLTVGRRSSYPKLEKRF